MKNLRAHGLYLVAIAVFMIAVLVGLPRVLRIALAILAVVLIAIDIIHALRHPPSEPTINWGLAIHGDDVRSPFPRCTVLASLVLSTAGAGYMWALVFHDGLHGLEASPQLDNSQTYPDANVAFIAAMGLLVGGLCGTAWAGFIRDRYDVRTWSLVNAGLGAIAFAVSRVFV